MEDTSRQAGMLVVSCAWGDESVKRFVLLLSVMSLIWMLAGLAAADEYRIIPVTAWNAGFLDQGDVDKLLGVPGNPNSKGDIRNANCNAVLVQVRRRADVCYPSALGEPYMSGLSPSNFNALQAMINAAHDTTGGKKRIEVHCWIVAFRTATGPVYQAHDDPSDPDNYWVALNKDGIETDDKAFDPGHPRAAQYAVDVCMDLVNNFDIDGIHLDYIRYTNSTMGFNPTSVARFNARYGRTGMPGNTDPLFQQWRRDQVTAVVRKVYAEVQASKPWVKVSGSFIGGAPSPTSSTREAFMTCTAYASDYSDWDSWMQEGIVDFGAPMTYVDMVAHPTDYANWLNFQRDRKSNRLMVPDAGVYRNYIDDAINMLRMTRDPSPAGNYGDGFGAYSYQSPYSIVKETSTVDPVYGSWSTWSARLLQDVTPTWADIPQMPWKVTPTKGHIGGTVSVPPDGDWADGAIVEITGPESRSMVCDGTGFYAFIDLTPGIYTITASFGAFQTSKVVSVTAGQIAAGDIILVGTDPTPPVITDVSVSRITDGIALVMWTTDDPATSQVEYDFVPHYGQSTEEDDTKLTSHSVWVSGLTPSTSYHFRVRSVNAAGLASYSDDIPFVTLPLSNTITVDELAPDCTLSGGWATTTGSSGWDGSYKYKTGVPDSPTVSAVWAPPLPRSGPYEVSIYYRASTNRTTDAEFTINHALGSDLVHVNQQLHDREWFVIGSSVQFNAGLSGNVTLTNHTTDTRNVIADAVRFRYLGDTTAPTITSVADAKYTLSTNTIQASWSGSDPQSGIATYRYAVGTAPGMADIKPWTNAGTSTSATINGLALQVGQTYYVSVRAVNGASLTSAPLTSDGITVARSVTSVVAAKALEDGQPVCFSGASVTARFPGKFYIEDSSRTSGIRVEATAAVEPNQTAQVFGRLGLADGCERALIDCEVVPGSMGQEIEPFAVVSRALGGKDSGDTPGVTGGTGLNNIGLLVRLAGRVTAVVSDGFYLDDGSGLTDESEHAGIKVWTGVPNSVSPNTYVTVTGAVSCRQASGGTVYPQVLARDLD